MSQLILYLTRSNLLAMNTFLVFINSVTGIAGIILLRISVSIIRTGLQAQRVKQKGIETEARILQIEVMNEPSRRIPFVRLKLAVTTVEESTFIASIATSFHPSRLTQLTKNGTLTIRYNPSCISQLQITKPSQAAIRQPPSGWQPVSTSVYLAMAQ
jgi:hypothetical protein